MEPFRELEKKLTVQRERLEYAVYRVISNLKIEGYTSKEPLPFAEKTTGSYKEWLPGEHWGDLFDCGWFHFTGTIPEEYKKAHLAVLVDLSAEGLIVDPDGNAVQGMTSATSRNEFPLGLWGKRTIEIQNCLNEKGGIDFWGDFTCMDVEGQYKNNGRVKEACLCVVDDNVRNCFYDWVVCQSLFVGLCENGDSYGNEVGAVMDKAADLLEENGSFSPDGVETENTEARMFSRHAYGKKEDTGLDKAGERLSVWPDEETEPTRKKYRPVDEDKVKAVRKMLGEILSRPSDDEKLVYSSIGHSHLDLLFLWPFRETPRKCARTLSTVMKMMDRFPEYKFSLSQAPVYMWMKEQYPDLYRKMLKRIEEKRLEIVGAFYIECDTNLPCGESLARQLLYGKRFFKQEFGQDMKVGFLPDVFGYSAALPQLFVKADVPYFTTNKLSMNDTNRFPLYTFWWYGLDGTKILTHMLPENSYTSASVPQMAIYGEYHDTDLDVCPEGIQLYGLGDGGGGPGYEHMERRRRSRNLKGCPKLKDEFISDFFDRIALNGEKYRSWHGELYFERHQGTYTSMAKNKLWNRTMEKALHEVEWLACVAMSLGGFEYPSEWLKECWQDVMLFQFHDCLPGSAIDRVYAYTTEVYEKRYAEAREWIKKCVEHIAFHRDLSGMTEPAVVVNPSPFERTENVERNGKKLSVTIAPYGILTVDFGKAEKIKNLDAANDRVMENDRIRVTFDSDGTLSEIYSKVLNRNILPKGKHGNVLNLYADENTHWDIEKAYLNRPGVRASLTSMKRCDTDTEQRLEMTYSVGKASTLTQTAVLKKGSGRLDFVNKADWHEEYQMLRVNFPVDVVAETASCEIQFGHIQRPTHHNTSWDKAKFEVCAHKFADLSDRNGGMAVLSDCKYGYKVWDGALDLCLLRSQNCPCDHGDEGVHHFTYSVYPHASDVWDGGVVREGYLLNYPLDLFDAAASAGKNGTLPSVKVVSGTAVIETIKKAEDSEDIIVRLYEAAGGYTRAVLRTEGYKVVSLCNILENKISSDALTVTDSGAELDFHAFEIHTLLLRKI